ncbi:unnamed protein product, partial [Fusarium graminearum]
QRPQAQIVEGYNVVRQSFDTQDKRQSLRNGVNTTKISTRGLMSSTWHPNLGNEAAQLAHSATPESQQTKPEAIQPAGTHSYGPPLDPFTPTNQQPCIANAVHKT